MTEAFVSIHGAQIFACYRYANCEGMSTQFIVVIIPHRSGVCKRKFRAVPVCRDVWATVLVDSCYPCCCVILCCGAWVSSPSRCHAGILSDFVSTDCVCSSHLFFGRCTKRHSRRPRICWCVPRRVPVKPTWPCLLSCRQVHRASLDRLTPVTSLCFGGKRAM